ncbi:MAG: hypothetical protein HC821_01030 [Lewinella sp.]|nr:hypothetical protein [Lewinella sp.]
MGLEPLATGCHALTSNFVTVIKERPVGGVISIEGGGTTISLCPGDGIDDLVRFDSTGASGGEFTYLLTDSNNVIIGLPTGDLINFDTFGLGVCRVWNLVYQGSLLAQLGDNAAAVPLADGCFALSSNFVSVNREQVNGGRVRVNSGESLISTCPGDETTDVLVFFRQGNTGANFVYVATDTNNVILALYSSDTIDFTKRGRRKSAAFGVCLTLETSLPYLAKRR